MRKVQEPMGYACYSQYEEAVRSVIDRTQQSIAAEMEANRHDSAKVLTKVACDLNLMLASTSICKAMRNGKHDWNAQRMMILHTNKWTGGPDVAASSFAERAKEMNIFYKLYANNTNVMGESEDPFGRGGAFDGQGSYGSQDTRRCRYCHRVGHIARNCPHRPPGKGAKGGGKGGGTDRRVCYRCGQTGHVAADCDNERVPRDQQNQG